ncbi:MAG: HD domain-containing protein [Bacilli bacterium]|nr:HD domain-containing protein [Bacilli bacterium]
MNQVIDQKKVSAFSKEVSFINNPRYKESIEVLISLLPDYFFEVPASSTGKYHPSFALGDGGLLRHTKVAVRIAKEMFNDEAISGGYTNNEKDLMIMALILHDGLKSGLKKSEYTNFDHPLLVSNYIKENVEKTSLKENEIKFLTSVIESHMGPWNTNNYSNVTLPKPQTRYQRFVHMCDYLASRKFLDVKFNDQNDIQD